MTRTAFRNHLRYSAWKYVLALAVCVMGVSLLFDMTRYQPPREHRVELYILSSYAQADSLEAALFPALAARRPELEELTVLDINLEREDMYSRMQLTTYLGAGQGDVLLALPAEIDRLAAGGFSEAFVDLSPWIRSGVLKEGTAGMAAYRAAPADGTEAVYAVPAGGLTGLSAYGCDPSGAVLAVIKNSHNPDAAAALIGLMQEMFSEK